MFEIRSKKTQLLRPLYASAVMAGLAFAGLSIVQMADDSAPPGISYIAILVLLIGLVRMFNWWISAGRTKISVGGEEVLIRGRFRTVRVASKEVINAQIIPGEWRPEWSRWAVHPQIVLELQDGRKISRKVLLDSSSVLREGPRLQDAIRESANGRNVSGSDAP